MWCRAAHHKLCDLDGNQVCVCVCEVMTALDSLPCIDNVWSQQPAEDEKPPSSFSKLYPSPISPPPSLLHSTISHMGGGGSHQTQDACHPPVAGHDNSAGHPAAPVVVGPWVEALERLADPLTVGVAAAALSAAHALVVQPGVDVHVLLALEASLRGGRREESGQSEAFFGRAAKACFKPIKNGFPTGCDGGGGDVVRCGFLLSNIFFFQKRRLLFTPFCGCQEWVWWGLGGGLEKKESGACNEGVRMHVCMHGTLCVLSRGKGAAEEEEVVGCCGIIHTASMLKGMLWTATHRKPHAQTTRPRIHSDLQ